LENDTLGITAITLPGCSIILDTCSLIYLTRLNLLENAGRCFPLFIPAVVLKEFRRKIPEQGLAQIWQNLERDDRLSIRATSSGEKPDLRGGEQACLELYRELRSEKSGMHIVIITDDGQACRLFRSRDLPFLNTPLLICALASQKSLAASEAGNAIGQVLKMGRYGSDVITTVQNHFQEITGIKLVL